MTLELHYKATTISRSFIIVDARINRKHCRGSLTLTVSGILGGNTFDVQFLSFSDFAYREYLSRL